MKKSIQIMIKEKTTLQELPVPQRSDAENSDIQYNPQQSYTSVNLEG